LSARKGRVLTGRFCNAGSAIFALTGERKRYVYAL
jgi:hypothetical protein